jgi:DNA-binding beta-propeller fold protein YncE
MFGVCLLCLLFFRIPAVLAQDNGFETPPDPNDVEKPVPVPLQYLDSTCVIAVLNRTTTVNNDGTWILPTVPANFGPVRARATCVRNGQTLFGQSDLFTVGASQSVNLPDITLGNTTSVPQTIAITTPTSTLSVQSQTAQLSVIATYTDGTTQNITAGTSGVQYAVSNPAIATISANGLVTAVGSGTVIVRAVLEGAQGVSSFQVALSVDSDGDGIPDDAELRMGLNPHDPTDALLDPDHDGLTNLQEYQAGTDIHNPDTDGDGLTDGQEVLLYHTNPLLADTDGDGVPDGVEIQTGTNPLDATSFNLTKALTSISVKPTSFLLAVNSLTSEASQQLTVTGLMIDGKTTIDLTSTAKGTNYSSSDLTICNFGAPDGNIFAGNPGACTITITNSGFTTTVSGTITGFSPTALSFVTIPGFANSVAVNGNYAYVAAGSAGLQVVNVTNRTSPAVVASLALAGNADGITAVGNLVFVADGSAGIVCIDVSNPLAPVIRSQLGTNGTALDIKILGNTAYVANGTGLFLADVTNTYSLLKIASLPLTGLIRGVSPDPNRPLVAVAADSSGMYLVDVTNPKAPVIASNVPISDPHQVAINGNYVYVANYQTTSSTYQSSLISIDATNPTAPTTASSITNETLGGNLNDLVISGTSQLALGADVFFVNGIPITDISDPTNLRSRAILNFPQRDDNGMGIAIDPQYVYLAADESAIDKFGTSGNSRLYIGQYQVLQDTKGIPPIASIVSPASNATLVQGSTVPITISASDDIAVAAVNLLVNGTPVLTDTGTSPYIFYYQIPQNATSITIGAQAVDFGGNVGNATPEALSVIPDPGTTVIGRVLDGSNNPLPGFIAQLNGFSATTAADGTFSIPNIPTVPLTVSGVTVNVHGVINGSIRAGSSTTVNAVAGGTTNVGDIITVARPLIVVDSSNGAVDAIDTSQNPPTVIATTGGGGGGVSMSPDASRAFVSAGSLIRVFDMTQNPPAHLGDISGPGLGAALSNVVTNDGRYVVSVWNQNTITVADASKMTIVSQLPLGFGTEVAVTADDTTVLLADGNSNVFHIFSLSPLGVLANTGKTVPYNFLFWATGIAMAQNGKFALVANPDANTVTELKIDSADNVTIGGPIPMCCSPWGVAITPDGKKAYVTLGQTNALAVLSIDTNQNVTDTGVRIPIPFGVPSETHVPGSFNGGISGIAAALDGKIYIANYMTSNGQGIVTVVDSSTDTVIGTISVPPTAVDIGAPQ